MPPRVRAGDDERIERFADVNINRHGGLPVKQRMARALQIDDQAVGELRRVGVRRKRILRLGKNRVEHRKNADIVRNGAGEASYLV